MNKNSVPFIIIRSHVYPKYEAYGYINGKERMKVFIGSADSKRELIKKVYTLYPDAYEIVSL